MLYYELSKDDRLTALSSDWDRVARAQGGHHNVLKKDILGRPIWDFISGQPTQSYLNALFFTCRKTMVPVATLYRCDSDERPRQYHMTVTPRDQGILCLTHIEVPVHQVAPPPDFRGIILRDQCAQCYGLKFDTGWVAAEPGHKAYFVPSKMGLCPKCRAMAMQAVSASRRAALETV